VSVALAGPRARDEIMRRIGAALGDQPRPGPVPRDYRRTGRPGDVVELFAERAAEYRATVRRVPHDRLPVEIAEALRSRGAHRIAMPLSFLRTGCRRSTSSSGGTATTRP
jgi:L-lactate dehydrogenase complex protein LldG